MNPVDYSRSLRRHSDTHQKQVKQQREQNEANERDLKKLHKFRESEQAKTYMKSKRKMEKTNQDTIDRTRTEMDKALESRKRVYDNALEQQKEVSRKLLKSAKDELKGEIKTAREHGAMEKQVSEQRRKADLNAIQKNHAAQLESTKKSNKEAMRNLQKTVNEKNREKFNAKGMSPVEIKNEQARLRALEKNNFIMKHHNEADAKELRNDKYIDTLKRQSETDIEQVKDQFRAKENSILKNVAREKHATNKRVQQYQQDLKDALTQEQKNYQNSLLEQSKTADKNMKEATLKARDRYDKLNSNNKRLLELNEKQRGAELDNLQKEYKNQLSENKMDYTLKLDDLKREMQVRKALLESEAKKQDTLNVHKREKDAKEKNNFIMGTNKKVSDLKGEFRNKLATISKNFKKEVSDLTSNNLVSRTTQKNNYLDAQELTAQKNRDNREHLNNEFTKTIKNQERKFSDEVAKQRKDFMTERNEERNKVRNKIIPSIQKSYSNDLKEMDRIFNAKVASQKERYDNTRKLTNRASEIDRSRIQDAFKRKYKTFEKESTDSYNKLREDSTDDRRQLVIDHENQKIKTHNDNEKKTQDMRSSYEHQIKLLEDNNDRINARGESDKDNMNKKFDKVTEQLNERAFTAKRAFQRENASNNIAAAKKLNDTVKSLNLKSNDQIRGFENKKEVLNDKIDFLNNKHERDTNKLKNHIQDIHLKEHLNLEKLRETHERDLKLQSTSMTEEFEKAEVRHGKQMKETAKKLTSGKDQLSQDYSLQFRQQNDLNTRAVIRERIKAQKTLTNQKEMYRDTLEQITKTNNDSMHALKEELAKEKTAFLENNKKVMHNFQVELKRDLTNEFNNEIRELETRLTKAVKSLNQTKDSYETQIDGIKEKNLQKIQELEIMQQERQTLTRRELNRALESKENEIRQQMQDMRAKFDNKLENSKHKNDVWISKLMQKYEQKLSSLRSEKDKEMRTKLTKMNEKIQRMREEYELREQTIRNQFEFKFTKLQNEVKAPPKIVASDA